MGIMVASFTDAWIETDIEHCYLLNSKVASFTDAWIETADNTEEYQPPFVASFTDAWIETPVVSNINLGNWMSHLLQMRGLKQLVPYSGALP